MNPQKDLLDVCKMIYADMERGHSINPYEHKATLKQVITNAEIHTSPVETLREDNRKRILDAVVQGMNNDLGYRYQVAFSYIKTWTMDEIKSFIIPEFA